MIDLAVGAVDRLMLGFALGVAERESDCDFEGVADGAGLTLRSPDRLTEAEGDRVILGLVRCAGVGLGFACGWTLGCGRCTDVPPLDGERTAGVLG